MEANPELGDNNNIFGTGNTSIDAMVKVQRESGINIVDYNRYASVPETQKIDYSKLTQVSDQDTYNVVSVQGIQSIKMKSANTVHTLYTKKL